MPDTSIEPMDTTVVETHSKPSYPLISNQPDRFGALSEAFLFVEEKRLYELMDKAKFWSIVAGGIAALPIIIHLYFRFASGAPFAGTVMDIAKMVVCEVLFLSLLALGALFYFRHKIMQLLGQLEDLAYFGDDMARFYMPYARSELKEFNDKIRKHREQPDMPSSIEIMKDVWPVISLLLKRDANILHWGKVGMKAYKALSSFFKGQNHSSSEST